MELGEVRRIIFAGGNGVSRSPMAAGILISLLGEEDPVEILSRGLIVQFPEPMNQKAEAILASHGISLPGFISKELKNEEITDKTLIFTMDRDQRETVLRRFPSANEGNTFVLALYAGEELETMDPYGGPLSSYGLCYETLRNTLTKFAGMLKEARTGPSAGR